MKFSRDVPLAPLTTLGVGGKARFFAKASSVEEVLEALAFARTHALPIFVLGGGSNIVIGDSGFDGLVLGVGIAGISNEAEEPKQVRVGAGVIWDDFVVWSIERGLTGIECLSGVPGTVGGAVVANLGAYGAQVSDTFVHAQVIDRKGDKPKRIVLKKEECAFSYHDSVFSRALGRFIILNATFSLEQDALKAPSYRDNRFDMKALTEVVGHTPSLEEVRDAVLNVREEKGSLIMKGRLAYKSAGSFFHMPFVTGARHAQVEKLARKLDPRKEEKLRPWAWKQPDGSYKIAPGFLLEYTEFKKGYVREGAGISPRHTLSIINVGKARAKDIAELARDMQTEVEKLFGIRLEREVEYVGDVEGSSDA
jgi:UDP-N-acetylmuramate dehydrogenase